MSDPTVDAEQPWLGLNSFTESTRAWFFGREEEIGELARRVQRKPLTVLFGQSGLGKTSILRAGLVPRLRPAGYCPVYVRLDYGPEAPSPAAQIKQAIFRETLASGTWTQTGAAVDDESLWEFLHHRDDVLLDAEGRALVPLLIFDQFEEVFTLAQANDAGRRRAAAFLEELADLAENRPPRALEARLETDDTLVERFDFARCDYRILIALREDYLAHLESLKAAMPSVTQNRMRLARMTGEQALEAVIRPGGALVSREVAEAIVRFVAGGAELRNAEVEPSLLSLICRELNAARIAQGRTEISSDLLAGSHATILAEFYERTLADQPAGVRRFVEDQLLTDSGFRENIAEERVRKAFAEAGAAPGALATLVDRRLLRIEERLDVRRVELTHDVLCGVVAASRQARQEREAREAAEAQLAAQREREAATRRALAHARRVAIVCGVLAVAAVIAAGFGVYGMRQAQRTHAMAETARAESERLIVYLLDDFYRELEPVGRLEIVGELAKRSLAYYDRLPAVLRGPDTLRNQALAQARYGLVLRNQGRAGEAAPVLATAVATLDGLRSRGDASEATAIGLATGLVAQARLLSDRSDIEARVPAERAVEVLETVAQRADASIGVRRARAMALTQLGLMQQRSEHNEQGLKTLRAALDDYRALDRERTDMDAAANFAITSAWVMDGLWAVGRPAEALAVGEEARAVATRVLEQHPTHLLALRGRALVASNASVANRELLRSSQRLETADRAAEDWLLMARVDPTNVISIHNLGVARTNAAEALFDLGRPRAAVLKAMENVDVQEAVAEKSALVQNSLANRKATAARFQAELGEVSSARSLETAMQGHWRAYVRSMPPASYVGRFWPRCEPVFAVEQALARGDLAAARVAWTGARDGLVELEPGDEPARRRLWAGMLRRLHAAMTRVELQAGDPVAAGRQGEWLASAWRELPKVSMESRRDQANDLALQALALVHLGRAAEAAAKAAPALEFQRELQALGTDDESRKIDLAIALVAAAAVDPARAKVLLDEARAAWESLPAEARSLRTSRWVDGLIAERQRMLR